MEDPRPHRRIHAQIGARISDGTYPAGSRLNVGLLADEFDVSRATVGKALRLLEADGAIVMFQGMGWFVNER